MSMSHTKSLVSLFFVSKLFPFDFFSHYPNVCHKEVTVRNFLMKLDSSVYEVKTVCCIQKRVLSLSQFLSHFPLISFFPYYLYACHN